MMDIAGVQLNIGEAISGVGRLAQEIKSLFTGEPTPEKQAEIKQKLIELESKAQEADNVVRSLQTQILIAELTGQSWLQRNWRPILMLTIVAIVANNYIFVPYLQLFGLPAIILDLPEKLWNLMTLGVGGYIVGRSGEKILKTWKEK
ncbi:MAG TPA: 3TM-type holin [Methanothrix sp.]|nr:3TM-type holin [Methanothrix sp.]HOL44630.1 3TM-type holin [Methanothrix sp.]